MPALAPVTIAELARRSGIDIASIRLYEEMGLLTTEKHTSWFDPGKFWSGDLLPLTQGYKLTDEIAVVLG